MLEVELGHPMLIKQAIEGLHAAVSSLCYYLEMNHSILVKDNNLLKARMELDKIKNEVFNSNG
jgi:hypothetical protein